MQHYSDLEDAKYNVVHEYPGGSQRLAPLVGMNPGTLSNKVNPSIVTHNLSVDESVVVQHAAQDFRILHAEAQILGHATVSLGDFSNASDMEVLNLWSTWQKDLGETAIAIDEALNGAGEISKSKLLKIEREMYEDFRAALELLSRLEGLCDV